MNARSLQGRLQPDGLPRYAGAMTLCRALPPLLLALALTACARIPVLDAPADPAVTQAPYPTLLPFEQLTPPPGTPATAVAGLLAQQAALEAAAADLRATP